MADGGHKPGAILKPLVAFGRTPEDCWRWLGNHDETGVPTKTYLGKHMPARRWLWIQLFGPIPEGLVVTTMPVCGNKACMNPWHFRACHQADANRAGVGTVFLPADVVEIKRAKKHRTPCTARILAERYGCSVIAIRDIWSGRTWRSRKAPNFGPRSKTGGPAPEACAHPPHRRRNPPHIVAVGTLGKAT